MKVLKNEKITVEVGEYVFCFGEGARITEDALTEIRKVVAEAQAIEDRIQGIQNKRKPGY